MSIVNLIDRIASAYAHAGASMIVRMIFGIEQIVLGSAPGAMANFSCRLGSRARGCGLEKILLRLLSASNGTSARHSVARTDFTCSLVRNLRSIISRKAASPPPIIAPATIVAIATRDVLGLVLTADAAEICRASLIGNVCCWTDSVWR